METGHNLKSLKPSPTICRWAVLDAIWMLSVSDQVEQQCCCRATPGEEQYLESLDTCSVGPTSSGKPCPLPQSADSLQLSIPNSLQGHPLSTLPNMRNKSFHFIIFLTSKTFNPSICSFSRTVNIISSTNLRFCNKGRETEFKQYLISALKKEPEEKEMLKCVCLL